MTHAALHVAKPTRSLRPAASGGSYRSLPSHVPRGALHPRDPPLAGHRRLRGAHVATIRSTPTLAPEVSIAPPRPIASPGSGARRDEDFSLVDPRAHRRCGQHRAWLNRPIVAHLPRLPLARAATTRRVLAPSHQRCSPVQLASDLGHERRRRGDRRDGWLLLRQLQRAKLRPRTPPVCVLRQFPARCVRHPMDWAAGVVLGRWAVGGGKRWRAAGDEDRHAAFFLTSADERNKPEFCKSDPRRRRG